MLDARPHHQALQPPDLGQIVDPLHPVVELHDPIVLLLCNRPNVVPAVRGPATDDAEVEARQGQLRGDAGAHRRPLATVKVFVVGQGALDDAEAGDAAA